MKFVKGTMALAVAAVALGSATVASAAEIVTEWDYKVSAVWTSFNTTGGPGVVSDPLEITWGSAATPAGTSSLEITDSPKMGSIETCIGGGCTATMIPDASFQPAITLVHNNFPIFAPLLTDAVLEASLMLTPTMPNPPYDGTDTVMLPTIDYNIGFAETLNVEPCASASGNNPCNDIFVQLSGVLNQSFDYMDQTYFVNILPAEGADLGVLTPAECAAAGQPAGCFGFTTEENASTPLPFRFAISTRPLGEAPEPALLALMGIGFAGVAAARRRKKA
jgi:hypothetical protein